MNIILLVLVIAIAFAKPKIPLPTEDQVQWLERGMVGFIHFGVNTYTDREWGLGDEDPRIFNPIKLNTTQWIEAFQSCGINEIILVTKHHDGFMLFPSKFSNHSVISSTWKDGKGDVVREFVDSCRQLGAVPSFYLSPWDRYFYNMTWKPEYNDYYAKTLDVLTSRYGPIYELWWDGANAQEHMTHYYDWKGWYSILKHNQPHCLGGGCGGDNKTFDCGPDISWGWTETGMGNEENWHIHAPSVEFPGEELVFAPLYLDVSIRPGWFYHAYEEPKTLAELVHIYFLSVGRNYQLQLNVPPNRDGLFDDRDILRLREFGEYLERTFSKDEAWKATEMRASSFEPGYPAANVVANDKFLYWKPAGEVASGCIELLFDTPVSFNVVMTQEFLRHGQRVAHYSIAILENGEWEEVARGTTIGVKKLNVLEKTRTTTGVRLTVLDTWNNYVPEISRIGLFNSELYCIVYCKHEKSKICYRDNRVSKMKNEYILFATTTVTLLNKSTTYITLLYSL